VLEAVEDCELLDPVELEDLEDDFPLEVVDANVVLRELEVDVVFAEDVDVVDLLNDNVLAAARSPKWNKLLVVEQHLS
jgi:hypothetical protein